MLEHVGVEQESESNVILYGDEVRFIPFTYIIWDLGSSKTLYFAMISTVHAHALQYFAIFIFTEYN